MPLLFYDNFKYSKYPQFIHESKSERIIKIGPYLPKCHKNNASLTDKINIYLFAHTATPQNRQDIHKNGNSVA